VPWSVGLSSQPPPRTGLSRQAQCFLEPVPSPSGALACQTLIMPHRAIVVDRTEPLPGVEHGVRIRRREAGQLPDGSGPTSPILPSTELCFTEDWCHRLPSTQLCFVEVWCHRSCVLMSIGEVSRVFLCFGEVLMCFVEYLMCLVEYLMCFVEDWSVLMFFVFSRCQPYRCSCLSTACLATHGLIAHDKRTRRHFSPHARLLR
jgi:hypothetical protein